MAEQEKTGPVEHIAVTGKPQKTPLPNTTLAERAKANAKVKKVDVSDAETQPVTSPKKAKASK
jgi:hypothetical protein